MASPAMDTAMLVNVQFLDKANLACVSPLLQQQKLVFRENVKWLKTPRKRREGWARTSRIHFLYRQTDNRERSRPGRNRVEREMAVAVRGVNILVLQSPPAARNSTAIMAPFPTRVKPMVKNSRMKRPVQ